MQGAALEVSTNERLIRASTDQKTPVNYDYLEMLEATCVYYKHNHVNLTVQTYTNKHTNIQKHIKPQRKALYLSLL